MNEQNRTLDFEEICMYIYILFEVNSFSIILHQQFFYFEILIPILVRSNAHVKVSSSAAYNEALKHLKIENCIDQMRYSKCMQMLVQVQNGKLNSKNSS